ncbi:MAG: ABC transporter ATP-binding protein [Eubacteriales bacterium]
MMEIKNLSAFYGKRQVLFDIDLCIARGRFTAVIGRNGSGKSTLLASITSQIPHSGRVTLAGRDIAAYSRRERAKLISILPQSLPLTEFGVGATVAFGREPYLDVSGKLSQADRAAVDEAVRLCGIGHLTEKKLSEVSGGERQTVYLAMILAQGAEVMLLDEPTTYMDAARAKQFLGVLKKAQTEKNRTVVAVMHDISQVMRYADDIILMDGGRVVLAGTREAAISSGEIERVMEVEKHTLQNGEIIYI